MSKLVAGIDLHSNNLVCSLMTMDGRQIWCKRFPASLPLLLQALKPYRKRLAEIAVESTFNWYWLIDGLMEEGYSVKLANPAAMRQYEGLKQTNDDSDAHFLAELLRLRILPTGHIYDKSLRPVRDMLRRRMGLVQMRTSLMMSLKSMHIRTLGTPSSQSEVKRFGPEEMLERFEHPAISW